jgi:hypothetical protein
MPSIDKYAGATVDTGDTVLIFPAGGRTAAGAFDCRGVPPLGLVTPSNWLACTLTFKALPFLLHGVPYDTVTIDTVNGPKSAVMPSNAQLAPVKSELNDGTDYSVITTDGYGYYYLPAHIYSGVKYLNIVSSVDQTNAPVVSLILSPVWQGIHA